jgi:phospholipid transport system substrate-binding protein
MLQRRRLIAALAGGVLVAVVVAWATPAPAAELEKGAEQFIQSLAKQAVDSLTDAKVSRAERIRRFRDMFHKNFAVEAIGRWILGRHWRTATEAERAEYMKLFEDLMVVSYVDRFAEYAGESLRVNKAVPENASTATVFSEIVRPHQSQPVRVDWRVGRKDTTYKIVDVVVEGTSMSNTLRADFTSTINQKGGSVSGLIEELRKKTESLKEEAQRKP